MALEPIDQVFTVSAAEFLAGIDEMTAATDRLAGSIDQAVTATGRLDGTAATATGAETGLSDSADAVVAALDRQAAAIDSLSGSLDANVAATDANTAAIDHQSAALDTSAASAGRADTASSLLGRHAKLAFLGIAAGTAYAIVKAAGFQEQLTRLQTAAGLTHANMTQVGRSLLQIGDATGFTGTQIAEAMYHPVSAGMKLQAALKLVAGAAKLAQIHGASLEDTAYSLSSVMKAYNYGAHQAGHVTALLNAIVGQGDMRFQDFNQSIKNWTPTGAAMGVSIQSMGAAIAYLTDRGNSAEVASTRLTMGLSMVTSGSKSANEYLSALGLTTGTLALRNQTLQSVMLKAGLTTNKVAADLRKPDGIYVALKDIKHAFGEAGLSANQANQVMAKIFGGGRSDKAMMSLLQNLDGVRSKYRSIGHAVHDFGHSWAKTQQTVAFQFHKVIHSVENLAISFGQLLLPAVEHILGAIGKFIGIMQRHPVIAAFAGALIAVVVAIRLVSGAMAVLDGAMDANPIGLVVLAIAALVIGLYELYQHCALIRRIVHDVASFFATAWHEAMHIAGAVVTWFVNGPLKFIRQQIAVFTTFWHQRHKEIMEVVHRVWAVIQAYVTTVWNLISIYVRTGLRILADVWRVAWGLIRDTVEVAWRVMADVITTAVHVIRDIIAIFIDLVTGHWHQLWQDVLQLARDMWDGVARVTRDLLTGLVHIVYDLGKNIIQGLIDGIKAMAGGVWGAVKSIGSGIVSGFKGLLGIHSPSTVMREIGIEINRGLVLGLEGTASEVKSAVSRIASIVAQAASGGLITSDYGQGIVRWVENDNTRLQALATRRAKIMKEIATAQKYAAKTQQAVNSWAGLTNLASVTAASSGGTLSSTSILADLQAKLAKIREFKRALQELARRGLNRNLLNQIIQAGPDQGLQLAQALLDGPVSVIRQMDRTQHQINAAAAGLGHTSADLMYDSGRQVGHGFLSGLKAQENAITKLMEHIARRMVATLRRELGISSPSRVMHHHGRMIALGLAQGIDAGLPLVDAAVRRMARAVSQDGHMAPGLAVTGRGSGAGAGAVTVQMRVEVHGYIGSEQQLASELYPVIQAAVLQANRRNATNGLSLSSARAG